MSYYRLKVVQVVALCSLLFLYCCIVCCIIAQHAWAQLCMLGPHTSEHKITHHLDVLPQFSGTRD